MTLTRRQLMTRAAIGGVGVALAPAASAAAAVPPIPPFDSSIGGVSNDWPWFDANVGAVDIYRDFDIGGFHYETWQQTAAFARHPTAPANDYSFEILPRVLADPLSGAQAQVAAFLATTPLNLQVTNFHEPDNKFNGLFTPAEHRAGTVALANLVRAQNALDGGIRRTSVILMNVTLGITGTTKATDWWPTDALDGGHADIISVDAYALPHATNTSGVPAGYTDGLKWKTPTALLNNVYKFAATRQVAWSVSELGYLEDVNDPFRKANTLRDLVAWARSHGARHLSYFDARGPRADWRLRYSNPIVPSQSLTSNATMTWRSLAAS
jgi:hypothetical protein